jgi:hypothetical protein
MSYYDDNFYMINKEYGTTVESKIIIELPLKEYRELRKNVEFKKFLHKEQGIVKEEEISETKIDDNLKYKTFKQFYTNIPSIIQWYIGTEELIGKIDLNF